MKEDIYMEENKKNFNTFQNIVLENREKLNVTGINDVFSFDDQIIIIETLYNQACCI